ncbi:hypothetical protein Tco_1029121 [Tanacetum coccineum]|uniref:Uncharacterized protein n=1 Tax=Tanacetum coccineum TaxID=301880 RepID=A0ABQ5G2V3_9ASTR
MIDTVVSTGSGYAVLISLNEYAVLDRKLDTPYPIEVDTPYLAIDQDSGRKPIGSIRRIQGLDTAYWGFPWSMDRPFDTSSILPQYYILNTAY